MTAEFVLHERETPQFLYWYTTIILVRFAKRGLIHASDFATLMSHNFGCH